MLTQDREKNKKILITTGLFSPDIGGPATYSRILAEQLPRHGFEVDVLSFGRVRHLPKVIRHVVYFCKVFWRARKTDLIYTQDPVSVGLPSYLVSLLLKKRFLLKMVGDYAWEQGVERFGVRESLDQFLEKKRYSLLVRFLKVVEKYVALGAERVVVPSFYLKKVVWKWGVPQGKITVIPNAFEDMPENNPKVQLRESLGYEGASILSAGRLVPWKGFEELIEVMPEILKEIPEATLRIVGEGPERGRLEAAISRLKLEKKVILVGRLTKSVLVSHIAASDLFVLNSSYEGFSHQLLDVMALGTPIVATDCGGNPELLDHEKTALLVQQGQRRFLSWAIIKLLKDKVFADRLASEAKQKVQEFNKERMITSLVALLR